MRLRSTIAVLMLGTITAGFPGVAKLAEFSKKQDSDLLVYFRNANDLGVLRDGKLVPLTIQTSLSTASSCCDHRALPSLSHHGTKLAYVRLQSASPHREAISLYDLTTGKQADVFDAVAVWAISWSPTDDWLAIVAQSNPLSASPGESDLYVADLATKRNSRLTRGGFALKTGGYTVSTHSAPSWSKSQGKIALEAQPAGSDGRSSAGNVIAVFDLQSASFSRLSEGTNPAWSPSGEVIAFLDTAGTKCFTARPDGTGVKELFAAQGGFLTTGKPAPIFFPVVWSPKGDELLFHQWVDTDLVLDLYRFNLATSKAGLVGRGELQVVDWRKTPPQDAGGKL
jgi:hypothetical protein